MTENADDANDVDALDSIAQLSFTLGEVYGLDERGRLHRRARDLVRQAAELERAAQERELIREELDAPLPQATVEHLQDSHDAAIAQQLAQAEISARRADELHDHLVTQQEEQLEADSDLVDEQVSPAVYSTPAEELAEQRENADHPRRKKGKQ